MISFLRRHGFNLVLLICLLGFVAWQRVPMLKHGEMLTGMQLPDSAAATVDGKLVRLSDYKDRTVILSFWATWCLPCKVERPLLIGLKEELQGRPFEILGISDEDPAVLRAYLSKNPTNFPMIADRNAALHDLFAITSYPTLIQIEKGEVVSVSHGLNPFLKFSIRHQVTGSYF